MCSACLQPLAEVPGALDPDLFPKRVTNHPSSCETEGVPREWDFRSKTQKSPGQTRTSCSNPSSPSPSHHSCFLLSDPQGREGRCGPGKNKSAPGHSSHVVVHPHARLCAKGFSHIITYYHVLSHLTLSTNAFPRNLQGAKWLICSHPNKIEAGMGTQIYLTSKSHLDTTRI